MGCGTFFSWNLSQKNLLVAIPSVGIPNVGLTTITSINQAHGNTSIEFVFHAIVAGFKKLIDFVWQLVFHAASLRIRSPQNERMSHEH